MGLLSITKESVTIIYVVTLARIRVPTHLLHPDVTIDGVVYLWMSKIDSFEPAWTATAVRSYYRTRLHAIGENIASEVFADAVIGHVRRNSGEHLRFKQPAIRAIHSPIRAASTRPGLPG